MVSPFTFKLSSLRDPILLNYISGSILSLHSCLAHHKICCTKLLQFAISLRDITFIQFCPADILIALGRYYIIGSATVDAICCQLDCNLLASIC